MNPHTTRTGAAAQRGAIVLRLLAVLILTVSLVGAYPVKVAQAAGTAVGTVTAWAHPSTGAAGPYTITNATFSCGAGSNRLLVAIVTAEVGTTALGNVTATKGTGVNFATAVATATATKGVVWIGYLTESQIAGNTNSIVITNSSGTAWTGSDVFLACYSGVNQAQPLVTGGTWTAQGSTGTTSSLSIPVANNGVVVYGNARTSGSTNPNTVTISNAVPASPAWTKPYEASGTGYFYTIAEKLVTAPDTPVTSTFTWASQPYANAAISLNPAAALDTTTAGAATATAAGTTSIAVSMPYSDDANGDNTYTVDYKLSADSTWTNWVTAAPHAASPYATTITGLAPATSYDVRVTYNDADGVTGTNPQTISGVMTYYTLTVNSGSNGSVTLNPPGGSYASGTVVTLTAAGNSGYRFSGWSGDLTGSANPTTITMNGDQSVTASFVPGACVTSRVSASTDDAEERMDSAAPGYVDVDGDTTNKYLQTYRAYGSPSGTSLNYWGMRFLSVNVPQGATIASASVTFRALATNANESGMTLWGQLAANPTTFVASTSSTYNISSATTRPRTTATASWTVPAWTSGSDYSTPDLSAVVQEIVNQAGWVAGNAMVIVGQASVNQNKTAAQYDSTSGSTLAPLLSICYSTGPTITTAGTLTPFSGQPGAPSAAQTYTVSGSNLAGDIVIDAPAGFEISTDNVTYGPSLTLAQSSGTVGSTTIYVRLFSATEGSFSGDIAHTSASATTKNVAVSGAVLYVYTLTAGNDGHGAVTLNPAGGSYNHGATVTLTPAPASGYKFSDWSGEDALDIVNTGGVYTIVMDGDKSVSANFAPIPQYTLTTSVTPASGGSVTLNPTGGVYDENTVVTVTAVPGSGFAFSGWAGDLSGSTNPTTITMTGNKVVEAIFAPAQSCTTVNLVAAEDTYMSGYNTDYNYGGVNLLKITNNSSGTSRGALLRWDTSSIPTNATVSSASMTLNVSTASAQAYNLYNMRRSWIEGTLTTGAASTTSANWTTYDGVNAWGTAGAANITLDRFDTNLWSTTTSTFTPAGSKTINLNPDGVAVVQGWIAGSTTNYGLTMQSYSSTSGSDDLQISSSENTTAANRPKLNITYCLPTANYTLSVGNDGHGTVTVDPLSATYAFGSVVTLTPVPASGYQFATWSGPNAEDPTDNGNGAWSITMDGDKSVTANFSLLPVNVAPNQPVLVQPTDNAAGLSLPPALEVTVSDANPADTLDVNFYGRAAGATAGEDFTLIVIPDTQNLAQYYPSVMYSQFQWIANQKTASNIVFATSVGDLVNTSSSTAQYTVADTSYDYLDAGAVSYSVGPGNHDVGGLFETYFGVSRFTGKSWYQGHYGSDNFNNYSFFSASGNDFILINLQFSPTTAQLDWADALLKANAAKRGIIVQHDILNTNNSWVNEASYTALKDNPNLFLMLCGHMHTSTDGSAYRAELGDDGHTIHILMTDFQDYNASNNTGYLRILRFSPANDKIYAQVYSPYTSGYLTNASNYEQMELVYDLAGGAAAPYTLIGSANDVANGSNAAIEWNGLLNSTEYEWYTTVSDGTETVTGPTWSFTTGDSSTNHSPVITEGTSTGVTMSEDGTPTAFSLTLNATDADAGDTLTWNISGAATHGTASASGTGNAKVIGYTPTSNYNGSDSFVVQVVDGNGGADTIIVNVTVSAVNDAPACSDTTLTTTEDAAGDAAPVCTDVDAGDVLTYSIVGAASKGAASVVAGSLHYVPNPNTNGSDAFTYKANDTHVDSNTATVAVTVASANDAPAAPILVAPADLATGVALPPTLEVTVTDPEADAMSVSFYGRPKTGGAEDFSIIVFPDTQKYANTTLPDNYATFYAMTQWIVDQKAARNIAFVTHVGDIVEDNVVAGWNVADAAFDTLDSGGVSYSVGLGNNDITGTDYSNFENYFGVARFTGKSTYGGHYGSNNANNYSLFSASGMDFIVINMNYNPSAAELAWADGLLTTYSDRRAIVESHNQLSLTDGWSNSAVYDALKGHANLFLMLSGHLSAATDGAAKRTDVYSGHTIYSTLQDYQSYTNVNNGYLRIYRFSPANDKIYMTTYSPTLAAYETADPDDTLEFAYAMPDAAAYQLIGTDADVASGAHASISWPGLTNNTEYEWYAVVSDGSLSTTGSTWSFTTAGAVVNTAPVISGVSGTSVAELTLLSFTATATDDGLPSGSTLAFNLTGAPNGASINSSTGEFTWTPTEAQGPNSYTFDVCVSDSALSDCETITVTVSEVNVAPVLGGIGNKSIAELAALNFTAAATDADVPVQTLSYSLSANAPTGAAITAGGAFTWTPTEAQGGADYIFAVCVSDGVAAPVCETIMVTVTEANVAPVLAEIGNKSIDELATLAFNATATDADLPANTLTFRLDDGPSGHVPAGATFTAGGAFAWTLTEAQGPGSYTFDVCVNDGAVDDCETITVTVNEVNVAPVLESIGAQTVEKDKPLTFTAHGNDTDVPVQTLSYSLVGAPSGVSIDGSSGAFSWTPAAAGDYSFQVCVSDGTVSDCETVTVKVTEGVVPVFPSSFYGEIHFMDGDNGPSVSATIEAYRDAETTPAVSAIIGTDGTNLTYALNVPAYASAPQPTTVTFKIGGRTVATANWVSETNVALNIHPPKANTGGAYAVLLADGHKVLAGSATDWGNDVSAYAWNLDSDPDVDSTVATPDFAFSAIGTYPIALKVTDAQGGEGYASSQMFVITLGGLDGQVYTPGQTHPVTVAGVDLSSFTVEVLYGDSGSTTPPTNAGTYKVVVNIKSGTQVVASLQSSLVIGKAPATVSLSDLSYTYDNTAKEATVTTVPPGVATTVTYNNAADKPVNAGSYAVKATITDLNYTGSDATGTLVIGKATATVTLGDLAQTYNNTAKHATATTVPAGLDVTFTYDGAATEPVNAGSYTVVGTVNDANYQGSATGTLVIGKATATVTLGDLAQTYNNTAKHATATTTPVGLNVTFTYNGSATAPTNAGNYTVVGTVNDANYQGSDTGTLVIGKATATVTLGNLSQTYDNTAKHTTATTDPAGLNVTFTYDGLATEPVNAGSYTVVGTVNDANYTGTAGSTLIIAKATATVTLSNLTQSYDGDPKPVTVTTVPAGLTVNVTYDGSSTIPSAAASYAVVATVVDNNYTGTANGTLVITALVHRIDLVEGWNLVSFNLKPADTSIAVVLASIAGNYDLVYAWDAAGGHAGAGNWMKYDPAVPYAATLTALEDKQGFWVHMTTADVLEVSGTYAESTAISLKNDVGGWNLVGYPSDDDKQLPAALTANGVSNYTLVIAYHAIDAADPWKLFDPVAPAWANDLNPMQPGWGYWIFVGADATWTVDY